MVVITHATMLRRMPALLNTSSDTLAWHYEELAAMFGATATPALTTKWVRPSVACRGSCSLDGGWAQAVCKLMCKLVCKLGCKQVWVRVGVQVGCMQVGVRVGVQASWGASKLGCKQVGVQVEVRVGVQVGVQASWCASWGASKLGCKQGRV